MPVVSGPHFIYPETEDDESLDLTLSTNEKCTLAKITEQRCVIRIFSLNRAIIEESGGFYLEEITPGGKTSSKYGGLSCITEHHLLEFFFYDNHIFVLMISEGASFYRLDIPKESSAEEIWRQLQIILG